MGSNETGCKTRGVKLFALDHIIGPFRYIRFVEHASRMELAKSENAFILRLGGLELYGNLYNKDADVFNLRTCKNKTENSLFSYVFFCLFLQ